MTFEEQRRVKLLEAVLDAARAVSDWALECAIKGVDMHDGKCRYLTPEEMGFTVIPWRDNYRLFHCDCGRNHVWPQPHFPMPCACGKTHWARTLKEQVKFDGSTMDEPKSS